MFPDNICQNIDILVVINVRKNNFGFHSNRKTQGQKHRLNNLYFKYQVCQMKLRHLNTFLQFRLLFHEPHCILSLQKICFHLEKIHFLTSYGIAVDHKSINIKFEHRSTKSRLPFIWVVTFRASWGTLESWRSKPFTSFSWSPHLLCLNL